MRSVILNCGRPRTKFRIRDVREWRRTMCSISRRIADSPRASMGSHEGEEACTVMANQLVQILPTEREPEVPMAPSPLLTSLKVRA